MVLQAYYILASDHRHCPVQNCDFQIFDSNNIVSVILCVSSNDSAKQTRPCRRNGTGISKSSPLTGGQEPPAKIALQVTRKIASATNLFVMLILTNRMKKYFQACLGRCEIKCYTKNAGQLNTKFVRYTELSHDASYPRKGSPLKCICMEHFPALLDKILSS